MISRSSVESDRSARHGETRFPNRCYSCDGFIRHLYRVLYVISQLRKNDTYFHGRRRRSCKSSCLFPSFAAAFAGAPPSAVGRAAEAVAEAILDAHQRVSAASVTIRMPHPSIPAMFDAVGATIVRSRSLRRSVLQAGRHSRRAAQIPIPRNVAYIQSLRRMSAI
jgi:hypothetical protein